MAKQWYVVHTYSGFEKRVKEGVQMRVEALGLQDEVGEILIPTENIVEMKGGKKVVTSKKFFPGYILVEVEMSDVVWHVIRGTPKVTGFVGSRKTPTPLTEEEFEKIKEQIATASEKPRPKFDFKKGEAVRIIDGPFNNFTGKVDEVNHERNTLKIMVNIFGRSTPVELDFLQVAML